MISELEAINPTRRRLAEQEAFYRGRELAMPTH
jgi:hypothetical protein